jgi:hypothetical protein
MLLISAEHKSSKKQKKVGETPKPSLSSESPIFAKYGLLGNSFLLFPFLSFFFFFGEERVNCPGSQKEISA